MMIGAIIGVGIFGLPYAFAQSGIAIGLFWLIIVGGLLTILQLMFAEVVVQTEGKHRLAGYIEIYLGRKLSWIGMFGLASGIWGAMTAYIIVGGRFLFLLLNPLFGGPELVYSIIVAVVATYLIYRGLIFASKLEVILIGALLFLFTFIILLSIPEIQLGNFQVSSLSGFFLPYGVILFSMAGTGIVPELKDVLGKKQEHNLGRVIIIGMSVIMLLFGLFSLTVVGVTGAETSQTAFDGLIPVLGPTFRIVATLLGSITILSIYMVLGIELQNTLRYDFHMKRVISWLLVTGVPIILFASGVREFINLIGFVGAVFGGITGILLALTYKKMKKSPVCRSHKCLNFPDVLTWLVIAIFAGGIAFQIISIFVS